MTRSGSRAIAAAARVLAAVALLATAAFVVGGQAAAAPTDSAHIHGLAFDAADGALLLGTHDGLYRLGPNDTKPRKVGTVSYDLMGLAVIGPRSYVASGHPDSSAASRKGLPANLGLIRTDDGGKRWRPVSLLGGADFHLLRARDNRVLAYDVTRGRLLASLNAGRTWKPRTVPSGVADFALGPRVGAVAASTSDGVLISDDNGVTYRPRARDIGPGLLAWPSARRLLLVDADGVVHVSADGGRTFARRGTTAGRPAALAAVDKRVAVLLDNGRVLISRNDGRRFDAVSGS